MKAVAVVALIGIYFFGVLLLQLVLPVPSNALDIVVLLIPTIAAAPIIYVLAVRGVKAQTTALLLLAASPIGFAADAVVWRDSDLLTYIVQLAMGVSVNFIPTAIILAAFYGWTRRHDQQRTA